MTRTNFGTSVMNPAQPIPHYAGGGAIEEDPEASPMENTFGAQMDRDISSAMGIVNRVLNFGRKANGLPEVQAEQPQQGEGQTDEAIETAGMLPSKPFSESEKPQPMPGPLPPTKNPFGKRVEAETEASEEGAEPGPSYETAGMMPSVPFSETPKPQPMPGPLPPTSNPFGKRVDAGQSYETAGMIPSVPFNETPKPQPAPGHIPLQPWEKPFGKRVDAEEEAIPTDEETA